MAVLVIVFAVLLFARTPSNTAQIAPAAGQLDTSFSSGCIPNRAEYRAQAAATLP
jgi:hypothetical protein